VKLIRQKAERREISESRFTSLDRKIMREASNPKANFRPEDFEVIRNPTEPGLSERARLRTQKGGFTPRCHSSHRPGLGTSCLIRRPSAPHNPRFTRLSIRLTIFNPISYAVITYSKHLFLKRVTTIVKYGENWQITRPVFPRDGAAQPQRPFDERWSRRAASHRSPVS
jgi:hypothetical protein